jgi:hypothetical protein
MVKVPVPALCGLVQYQLVMERSLASSYVASTRLRLTAFTNAILLEGPTMPRPRQDVPDCGQKCELSSRSVTLIFITLTPTVTALQEGSMRVGLRGLFISRRLSILAVSTSHSLLFCALIKRRPNVYRKSLAVRRFSVSGRKSPYLHASGLSLSKMLQLASGMNEMEASDIIDLLLQQSETFTSPRASRMDF